MARVCRMMSLLGMALLVGGCEQGSSGGISGLSKSEVRGSHGQKLAVYKPGSVDLKRGGAATMTVRLRRENFSGEVTVSISQLPAGVEAVDAPRATRSDSIEVVFRASDKADLVKNQEAMVTAAGPEGIRATETFKISVRERS